MTTIRACTIFLCAECQKRMEAGKNSNIEIGTCAECENTGCYHIIKFTKNLIVECAIGRGCCDTLFEAHDEHKKEIEKLLHRFPEEIK